MRDCCPDDYTYVTTRRVLDTAAFAWNMLSGDKAEAISLICNGYESSNRVHFFTTSRIVIAAFGAIALESMASSNINISMDPSLNGTVRTEEINEYLIECFVRFRDSLGKARQRVVEDHVKNYIKSTAIEKFYRQFYDEYDRLEGQSSPRIDSFVASLFD